MNEKKLNEEIQAGEHADRILNDPMVRKTIDDMRHTLYGNLESSSWNAIKEREEIYRTLKVLGDFERRLGRVRETGTLAQRTLEGMKRFVRIK